MQRRLFPHLIAMGLALALLAPAARAQGGPDQASQLSSLGEMLDRIPNLSPFDMPSFLPRGMFHIYSSPHFGDLIHNDYMRVPIGLRAKTSPDVESYVELEGYFTHGLADSAGYGLDRLRTGIKYEPPTPTTMASGAAWSTGFDFISPLSRPPKELSDGYQHSVPYVAVSRVIAPDEKLLGFGSFGADLINHTQLPSNFGRNQLHSNSLNMTAGLVRDWKHFRGTLTASLGTTVLLSDEHHQVFGLRPAIGFPLTRFQGKRTRLMVAFGAYTVWGPDGHEIGLTTSLRVDFIYKTSAAKR